MTERSLANLCGMPMHDIRKLRHRLLSRFIFAVLVPILCVAAAAQERSRAGIIVNATTKDLKRIHDLGPENFRVAVDRNPVHVTAVRSEGPRRAILVLDASGSMILSESGWDIAKMAAQDFVTSVPKDCYLGLIIFGAGIIHEVGFNEDRQRIKEALNQVAHNIPDKKLTKRTTLYEVLQHASDLLSPAEWGDMIYIITDGEDSDRKTKNKLLGDTLLPKQIRLFPFILDDAMPAIYTHFDSINVQEVEKPDLLIELSRETGGSNFIMHPNDSRLRFPGSNSYRLNPGQMSAFYQALKNLYSLMFNYYRLDLNFSAVKKASKISLDILDGSGQPTKDVKLFYTPRLYPVVPGVGAPQRP